VRTHLTPRQAVEEILTHVKPLAPECIPLTEARGRVLAQEVSSPIDLPPWDNSAMDGYAVRSADVRRRSGEAEEAGEAELKIVEEVRAGRFPTRRLGRGECARIATGAPIPEGADTVIRQEDCTRLDDGRVVINDLRDLRHNVRPKGEDIRRGERVFEPGMALTPARLGVLASLAYAEVFVQRRPKVAFLTSGDELADVDETEAILSGRKIASSNTYTILALLEQAGAAARNLGLARDDKDDLRRRFADLAVVDMVVTSAGMSVGEHDYLRDILEERGIEMKFWRVKMRPGAPVGFGMIKALPWIGLPGNPVSTMVTFELFVRPALRKMMGHAKLFRRAVPARFAGEPVALKAGLQHFLRVMVEPDGDGLAARLTGPQGSGLLSSMAKADGLAIVAEGRTELREGEELPVMLLEESFHQEKPPY
jgi:molybdopterin molybdotransferase